MITIIGTGHVFDIGQRIRRIIEARAPQAVCVELDPGRYYALTHSEDKAKAEKPPDETARQKEKATFLYRMLGGIQEQIAEQYGAPVGGEMLAAVEAARERLADVLLIDDNAGQVVQRMWKEMPFMEKARLFFSAFGGVFAKKTTVEKELSDFQENPESFFSMLEKQMPTIKRVLIDERNEHMATRVREAAQKYLNIAVIVGDGHVPGMSKLLADLSPEIMRLKELRMDNFAAPSIAGWQGNAGSATVSFYVEK